MSEVEKVAERIYREMQVEATRIGADYRKDMDVLKNWLYAEVAAEDVAAGLDHDRLVAIVAKTVGDEEIVEDATWPERMEGRDEYGFEAFIPEEPRYVVIATGKKFAVWDNENKSRTWWRLSLKRAEALAARLNDCGLARIADLPC